MRFVGTALVAGTIGVVFLLAQGGWIRAGTQRSAELEKATQKPSRQAEFRYSHFRDIIGTKIENVDGERIGEISDLVVELRSGRAEYVVVKSGGFIRGRRLIIVPVTAVVLNTTKAGIAAVDVSRRQWIQAPEFSRKDLPLLNKQEKANEITRFYERGERALSRAGIEGSQRQHLSATGRGTAQTTNLIELCTHCLAKDLMRSEVFARQNTDMGEISDLLLDLRGTRPAYVIVSTEQFSDMDTSFAFPLKMLTSVRGPRVAILASRRDFERARPWRLGDLQNSAEVENNEIFRYERQEWN